MTQLVKPSATTPDELDTWVQGKNRVLQAVLSSAHTGHSTHTHTHTTLLN